MGIKDLKGMAFSSWTVVGDSISVKVRGGQNKTLWLCRCTCGRTKNVYQHSLTSGKSKSCGCLKELLPAGAAARNNTFATYKSRAKRDGVPFELSREDFRALTGRDCYYCGKGPSNFAYARGSNGIFRYNGLDRKLPVDGYTLENVVTACAECNMAKRMLSPDGFFDMVKRIYERHFNEKKS